MSEKDATNMMTVDQFRLAKLAEEGGEVTQAAIKQSLHGGYTSYNGKMNRVHLREEIIDVMIMARLLISRGQIEDITPLDVADQFLAKREKIVRISRALVEERAVTPDLTYLIPETLP